MKDNENLVFCEKCDWYEKPSRFDWDNDGHCVCSEFITVEATPISRVKMIKFPTELNKNNNCSKFKKKGKYINRISCGEMKMLGKILLVMSLIVLFGTGIVLFMIHYCPK